MDPARSRKAAAYSARSSKPYARPARPPQAAEAARGAAAARGGGAAAPAAAGSSAPTKAQTSLSLSNRPLPAPLPSLASHPDLTRLDLSKVSGALAGVGAGWIGDAFGSQLTWLNLSHCAGLGEAGPGAWKGFEKLTGLVVLTLQSCDLTELPQEFASLMSLKAFVATHNSLSTVPEAVVSGWPLLNSLILSHNPLKTLPSTLPSLTALAKLSVSNTPLPSSALTDIDLSALPFLRMVSASHTPNLATLPEHFRSWGTGLLPAAQGSRFDRPFNTAAAAEGRRGDGLEVVELSGSGITWDGMRNGVGQGMPGLRSLGLKGCPVTEREDYKDAILALLPALQILDNARLVERKRKGPALVQPLTSFQASKVPGKEEIDAAEVAKRAQKLGIEVQGPKREWGVKRPLAEEQDEAEDGDAEGREERKAKRTRKAIDDARREAAAEHVPAAADGPPGAADDGAGKRRKRRPHAGASVPDEGKPAGKATPADDETSAAAPAVDAPVGKKLRKRKPHSAAAATAPSSSTTDAKWREKQAVKAASAPEAAAADVEAEPVEKGKRKRRPRGASPPPSSSVAAEAPAKAEKTSVLKVVEVKPKRGKKTAKAGGIDLEQVFGKKEPAAVEAGGWDD